MSFWEHWHKTRDTDTGDISPGTDHGARSAAGAQCTLTRVIFPDLATSVVSSNTGESIRAMISRLLDKRNMKLTSFDVFSSRSDSKPLDLSEDCAILHCTEVRVEARILFRLELPSHKSIGVKVSCHICFLLDKIFAYKYLHHQCSAVHPDIELNINKHRIYSIIILCRPSKPKQCERFLPRSCSSMDGISMKWMCMLMRTPR